MTIQIKEQAKCELCEYEDKLRFFKGRWLCNQCYEGEVDNPEHQLEESIC